MKKRILSGLLITLLLLLTGCGGKDTAPPASSAPVAPPAGPPPVLTEADVLSAYQSAAEAYDWFAIASLTTDGNAVEQDGLEFRPVADSRFPTFAAFSTYLQTLFSDKLVATLLSEGQYRDIDGKLYGVDAARGSNIYVLDKTVTVAQLDERHWEVTLLFYADSYDMEYPSTTMGYSQTRLEYSYTDGRWCFMDFCPSDNLDMDAETVYQFTYDDAFFSTADFESWDTRKLALWMLHADGGWGEGSSDLLSHRALTDTDNYFATMAFLSESPWENADYVQIASAYDAYSWFTVDEQKQYVALLDTYQPKNAAEQRVLEQLQEAYQSAMDSPV